MVDIKYPQERINAMFIIFPSLFIAAGLFVLGLNFFTKSDSVDGMAFTILFGLVFLVVGVGLLLSFLKKAIDGKKEVVELRQQGKQLFGEILHIEEHVTITHGSRGGTHHNYSYNFIVKYADPESLEPIIAESVVTTQKYELKSPQCQIRVLNGKVLVEKANVEIVKNKYAFVPILVFVIFILIVLSKQFNLF